MERMLIHENSSLYNQIRNDIRDFKPALEKVKKSYEALELGPLTNEIFADLKTAGTKNINQSFRDALDKEVTGANISFSLIKKNMVANFELAIAELDKAITELRKIRPISTSRPVLSYKEIGYQEDLKLFTAEVNRDEILEKWCRIYLNTKEEIDLYNTLKEVSTTYIKFLNCLADSNIKTFNSFSLLSNLLQRNDDNGSVTINAGNLRGLFDMQKRSQKSILK